MCPYSHKRWQGRRVTGNNGPDFPPSKPQTWLRRLRFPMWKVYTFAEKIDVCRNRASHLDLFGRTALDNRRPRVENPRLPEYAADHFGQPHAVTSDTTISWKISGSASSTSLGTRIPGSSTQIVWSVITALQQTRELIIGGNPGTQRSALRRNRV